MTDATTAFASAADPDPDGQGAALDAPFETRLARSASGLVASGPAESLSASTASTPRPGTALQRGGAPFYRQLADDLRARIADGDFRVGEAIPSEAQLSDRYRTSRITVRHALALLEDEGLVHRQQGSGSFIRPRHFAVGPRKLTSFSEEVRDRGASHSSRLLSIDVVAATEDLPLDLDESGAAVRVERVRMADGRPIAYQVSHL